MGDNTQMKHCSNCLRDIALENFTMHEVHCRRNINLCEHCQEPVPRAEMDNHYEEFHASTKCSKCHKTMEKTEVDAHKDECPKRIVPCKYCELELVYEEMAAHTNYCGTRTEMCALCSQYIMQKDLEKHEQSGCTYPPPKPNNTTTSRTGAAAAAAGGRGRGRGGPSPVSWISSSSQHRTPLNNSSSSADVNNGFAVDEISRLMHMSSMNSHAGPTAVTRNNIRGGAHRGLKRTNEIGRGSGTQGRDRDVNDLRTYHDNLLAQHLAQDLGHEREDAPQWLMEEPMPGNSYGSDEMTLPCEFCEEMVPLDMLIQHQSGCRASGMDDDAFPSHPQPSYNQVLNNSRSNRDAPGARASPPPVLDNLSQDWISGPYPTDFTTGDELMLPCEFCNNPFPQDILIQHQAVCDANLTQTPRVRTPARPNAAPLGSMPWEYSNDNRYNNPPPDSRPQRIKHQANPTYGSSAAGAGSSQAQGQGQRGGQNRLPANGAREAIRGSKGTKKRTTQQPSEEHYEPYPTFSDWTTGADAAAGDGDEMSGSSRVNSDAHVRATLDTLLKTPEMSENELASLEKQHKMQHNMNTRTKTGETAGPSSKRQGGRGGSQRSWMTDSQPAYQASFASAPRGGGRNSKRQVYHGQENMDAAGPVGRSENRQGRTNYKRTTSRNNKRGGGRPPQGDV